MYLEVNVEYIELMEKILQVAGNIQAMFTFCLGCFAVYLVYRLFNSFF